MNNISVLDMVAWKAPQNIRVWDMLAYVLTKAVAEGIMTKLLKRMGYEYRSGTHLWHLNCETCC